MHRKVDVASELLGELFQSKGLHLSPLCVGTEPLLPLAGCLGRGDIPPEMGWRKTDSSYWDTLDNEWDWEVGQLLMITPCQKANGAEGNPQQRA